MQAASTPVTYGPAEWQFQGSPLLLVVLVAPQPCPRLHSHPGNGDGGDLGGLEKRRICCISCGASWGSLCAEDPHVGLNKPRPGSEGGDVSRQPSPAAWFCPGSWRRQRREESRCRGASSAGLSVYPEPVGSQAWCADPESHIPIRARPAAGGSCSSQPRGGVRLGD